MAITTLPAISSVKLLKRRGKLFSSLSLGMVVGKVWMKRGQFQYILSRMTNAICESLANAPIIFKWVLFKHLSVHKGEDRWKPAATGRVLQIKPFSQLCLNLWTKYHLVYILCSQFNGVFNHLLLIHLEVLILITWHRNKHYLSVPTMITKPGENCLPTSTKENLIVWSSLNMAVQNSGVKMSIQIKKQQN